MLEVDCQKLANVEGKLERIKIPSLMKKWWMKRIFDKV
jgi:hypothetical protein